MTSATPPSVRLLLHGAARCVLADGREVRLEAKDALLLGFVALQGSTPRAKLAALLWPEADSERARGALRQRLARLKKAVGVELLTAGDTAALAPGVVHEAGEGELLATLELDTEAELGTWLAAQRARGRQSRAEWLAAAAAQAETEGELAAALSHAQALVDLDPTSEHAHRRVMRLHYLRGDLGAALAAYDRCEQLLETGLGVSPSPETRRLREQVLAAELPPRHGSAPGPMPVTLLRPPRMIGRDAELAAVELAWASRQCVLVVGEAGIGKTRLLEEVASRHRGTLVVRARPGDSDEPLGTLARLLRGLSARYPAVTEAQAYGQLVAVLPGFSAGVPAGHVRVEPLLIELLSIAQRAELAALMLDDLQFADAASVDLLLEVREASAIAALNWGFGSRPAAEPAAAARIVRVSERTTALKINLQPLGQDALRELLGSLSIDMEDGGAAAAALLRRVGGNPLFVLEALRQAHLCGLRQFEVPARVSDITESRLLSVSDTALALARIAAVAREAFSPELAESVSAMNALALASPWRELESAQLMAGNRFTHDLVYEAALRSIPRSILQHLHSKVADFLETAHGEPARIAHHRLAAGQESQAVPHLAAAARLAWAAGQARELSDLFLRAAEIERAAGRASAAFDLLFDCADALSETGTSESYERILNAARPLASTPGEQARLRLLEAVGRHLAADDAGFARLNAEALLMAIAAGERRIEAECRFNKGWLAVQSDRVGEAIEHLAAAATLARNAGLQDRSVAMESSLATALSIAGQPQRAIEMRRRYYPQLTASGHYGALAAARAAEAGDAFELGQFDAALAAAEEALSMCGTVDIDETSRVLVGRSAAACYRRLGRFSKALDAFERVAATLPAQSPALASMADERARLYVALGRPDLAERSLAAAKAPPDSPTRALRRQQLARAHWLAALGRDPRPLLCGIALERIEELVIAWEWLLALGSAPVDADTQAQCRALRARCRASQAPALHDPLLALEALACAQNTDRDAAHAAVDAALDALSPSRLAALLPQCALWLQRACRLLGRDADAHHSVSVASQWLHLAVRSDVPAEFRDSFLNRNPVNRELLTLATRVQRAAPLPRRVR